MKIVLNGEAREIDAGMSLTQLVVSLGGDASRIAIERNREIVPKSAHATTLLEDGDQLEVVQFVGGG